MNFLMVAAEKVAEEAHKLSWPEAAVAIVFFICMFSFGAYVVYLTRKD